MSTCDLFEACQDGHLDVVKHLCGLPEVDSTACDSEAVQVASKNGYLDVVKYLCGLPDVDPTTDNNCSIRLASKNGHLDS